VNGLDDDGNGYIDDVTGYNFLRFSETGGSNDVSDGHGHGTHISGIIGAIANNGIGGVGINPHARILPVRFLDAGGRGSQYDGAAAIRYAVDNGAEVINCSWGYYIFASILKDAIDYAASKGVIVVGAAGNSGDRTYQYPASLDSVISVGSVSDSGIRSSFSNLNDRVDIMAFGESILSSVPGYRFTRMTGTSQAAGVVSGTISKCLSSFPKSREFTRLVVSTLTAKTTDAVPTIDSGRLISSLNLPTASIVTAMTKVVPLVAPAPVSISSTGQAPLLSRVFNFPNPVRSYLTKFGFNSSDTGTVTIKVFDLSGRLVKTIDGLASAGNNAISWDCMLNSGQLAANGTYLYLIQLNTSTGSTQSRGKLTVLH
ncbi:T9SS C-terminal target domain-containing protein, partial [bacterium]|nr:T9SS C-terminal target domain-containing protein [bacterium]